MEEIRQDANAPQEGEAAPRALTRREFLKKLGAIGGSALVWTAMDASKWTPMSRHKIRSA